MWIILLVIVLAIVIQISSVIGIEYYQYKKNEKQLLSFKMAAPARRTLVVYFSRSGNTELMAYQIAELTNAIVMNLEADDYKIGYKGWINAMLDARKQHAFISPEKMDLSGYDTIYIGAPIWLYSPAPPIYEFVGNLSKIS